MDRLKELYEMQCPKCGRRFEASYTLFRCPHCGQPLELILDVNKIGVEWDNITRRSRSLGVWKYCELLPPIEKSRRISLGEGNTPLVEIGDGLYVKFEGANPTGSFKDRGMSVGVSIAKSLDFRATMVASTGNTAASAAAYSARASMSCYVVVPRGRVALGKLAQAVLHGAIVVEIEGFFDDALNAVISNEEWLISRMIYPLNSFNPCRLEGQKTIAFEAFEEIGVPDAVVVPVGNAGNIYAIWKGFRELEELGLIDRTPTMVGVQAEGAAPLYLTWAYGSNELLTVESPSTVASAIRIGKPVNWLKAIKAVRESKGVFTVVNDDEILEAQRELARWGVGVEPASAASLAGYKKLVEMGVLDRRLKVVLIATGHALKDPEIPLRLYKPVVVRSARELAEVLEAHKSFNTT